MKLMVSAGEVSGDLHASRVLKELRIRRPDVEIFGMGGEFLRNAGCELLYDVTRSSVMGIGEVISAVPHFLKLLSRLKSALRDRKPDLLMLVDFPDFNIRLATHAHKLGIPILYYIPPKAWAWRAGRARKLAGMVDLIASIFPFEAEFYRRAGAKVVFVGHPILDIAHSGLSKAEARRKFGLNVESFVVGLMPGSRRKEVERLYPIMYQTVLIISDRIPDTEYILPLAPSIPEDMIEPQFDGLKLVRDDVYDVMRACDLLIVASGTATLEGTCMLTPMIIIYKVSLSTWIVAKSLVRIKNSGLPNIIAGGEIVPEYLQWQVTPQRIARKAIGILTDRCQRRKQVESLRKVRSSLGSPGASSRVAELICEMIG
ncbi:lipid-A-disaccharide synthase [Candidatus Poribacteria bacterium]|nr:lipid-A-disaccharide synthase [Candidatus Poribacteria bacterium]